MKRIKEIKTIIDDYMKDTGFFQKDNANMVKHVSGLFNWVTQYNMKKQSLVLYKKLSPEAVRFHENGYIHIHDLWTSAYCAYCSGFSLENIIVNGLYLAKRAGPAKRLDSILNQIINFIVSIQQEFAGAIAFSSFDTLLAPFIKKYNMTYKKVKQEIQSLFFNLNQPSRYGFQCVDELTKIMTENGWKSYNEISYDDKVYTFNIEKKCLETLPIDGLFIRKYEGIMYNLYNRSQNQLVSPKHKILRVSFNGNKYILEDVEDLLKYKTKIKIPVKADIKRDDLDISDKKIKLIAWIISEGSHYKKDNRISIYQSKEVNPKNFNEIKNLINHFGFEYTETEHKGMGTAQGLRIKALKGGKKILYEWFDDKNIKKIPTYLYKMSQRQAMLFLDTYIKGDGYIFNGRKYITTTHEEIRNGLQILGVIAGYCVRTQIREPKYGSLSKKTQYKITLSDAKVDGVKIQKKKYFGIVWCVTTKNKTFIAKRNEQVFITGNSPFVNLNVDINVPKRFKGRQPILGGEAQTFTYDDCKEQMDMINRAICEMHIAGDFDRSPFTFPIVTVQVGKSFNWNSETAENYLKLSSLRGQPYWMNYNVDYMDEDMNLAMCCRLRLNYSELIRHTGGIFAPGDSTGSIGVVTLNMSRIGYNSKSEEDIYLKIDMLLGAARAQLRAKRILINKSLESGLLPATSHHLKRGFKMHFGTIGILGMHDFCMNYLHEPIWDRVSQSLVNKVLGHINSKLEVFQVEDRMLYNLEQCYDDKTEILTKDGFKLFKDLTYNDEVMTFNKNTEQVEYQKPTKIVSYDHDDIIYHLIAKQIDIKVTEEHNIYVETKHGIKKFKKPYELNRHDKLRRTGKWVGEFKEYFLLPSLKCRTRNYDELKIPMNDWLAFFGLWVSDGYVSGCNEGKTKTHQIAITGTKKVELIKKVLDKLPFHYNISGAHFRIYNKQLWKYLSKFGNSSSKYIPKNIKQLCPEQLKILFKYMIEGDGYIRKNTKIRTYYTVSKKLADDVQEILLKIGKYGSISIRKPRSHKWNGKKITGKHQIYSITEIKRPQNRINKKKHISIEYYKGKVYCCEVPNHILVVRRNNKLIFCGNTPAERTASRLAYYDKQKYGNKIFITIDTPEAMQYTNSTHMPPDFDDLFQKIEIEGRFQSKFTGGSVCHLFLEEISNYLGLKKLINRICKHSQLGYFSFTPTLSNCRKCRQTFVGNFIVCPKCGAETDIFSRIVGYYRPVKQWNPAKQKEFELRKNFRIR